MGWISSDGLFRAGPDIDAQPASSDTWDGQASRARQDKVTADGVKLVCRLPPAPRPCRKGTRLRD